MGDAEGILSCKCCQSKANREGSNKYNRPTKATAAATVAADVKKIFVHWAYVAVARGRETARESAFRNWESARESEAKDNWNFISNHLFIIYGCRYIKILSTLCLARVI